MRWGDIKPGARLPESFILIPAIFTAVIVSGAAGTGLAGQLSSRGIIFSPLLTIFL